MSDIDIKVSNFTVYDVAMTVPATLVFGDRFPGSKNFPKADIIKILQSYSANVLIQDEAGQPVEMIAAKFDMWNDDGGPEFITFTFRTPNDPHSVHIPSIKTESATHIKLKE